MQFGKKCPTLQNGKSVANRITLGGIDPRMVDYLVQLAKRYDAQALKRFAPAKRYALVACFLAETRKTLLDHVVEMPNMSSFKSVP